MSWRSGEPRRYGGYAVTRRSCAIDIGKSFRQWSVAKTGSGYSTSRMQDRLVERVIRLLLVGDGLGTFDQVQNVTTGPRRGNWPVPDGARNDFVGFDADQSIVHLDRGFDR